MKLYGHPMSTCTRKVLTTLAEKGHEAEFVTVDITKGAQKQPEFLAHQPFGVVPVLDDGGFVLYESRAIIRYLDSTLSGPKLTPSDPKAAALMDQWTSVEQSYVSSHAMQIVRQLMFSKMAGKEPDLAIVAKGREDLQKPFAIVDKWFAKNQFFGGEVFSLADITWMPYMHYLAMSGQTDLFPEHLGAWWKRVSTRPTWVKVAG